MIDSVIWAGDQLLNRSNILPSVSFVLYGMHGVITESDFSDSTCAVILMIKNCAE